MTMVRGGVCEVNSW